MFGKEGTVERIFPPRKSYSLQRGRPQIQQNAPKLFQAWSESDRSLCCSHSWKGDQCQLCPVWNDSGCWWLSLPEQAAAGCRNCWNVATAPSSSEGLCRILASPTQLRSPQEQILPLDIPAAHPLCQGKGLLRTCGPGFLEWCSRSGCSSQTAGVQHIPCRFGIIWWLGGGQGPTPAFLCTLDTLTVTTASLRQDIPFPTSKFNSPSKVGS